jgi:hypothetical protein
MINLNYLGGIMPVGGIDSSMPAEFIKEVHTPNTKNMTVSRNVLAKRFGTAQLGATLSERILAYKELYLSGSYNTIRVGLTKVQKLNYTNGTWSDIYDTGQLLTSDATHRVDSTIPLLSGAKIIVFTNYIDTVKKWTGTGFYADLGGAGDSAPPKAKFCLAYGPYLLLAYISDGDVYPSRVQWCDTGNIEEWDDTIGNTGAIDLLEDGEDITGLSLYGSYVAVHKKSGIYLGYLVDTLDVFRFERKNTGAGAICFSTIQNLPNGDQIFLGKDGMHLFNGVSAPLIEASVNDELRESINAEYLHKSWSSLDYEKDEYWVGLPIGSQTEPETVYKYNYRTGTVHKDVRSGITAAGTYSLSTQKTWDDMTMAWDQMSGAWDDVTILALYQNIILGDKNGISSSLTGSNNDIAVPIDALWESKDFVKPNMCRWTQIELWAKGNTVNCEYSIDAGQTWVLVENFSLSVDYPSDDSPIMGYFDVVSTKIRFRFSNNIADETFSLKQFIIGYIEREQRR